MTEDTIGSTLYQVLKRETPFGPIIIPSDSDYCSVFAWDSGWNYFWLKKISQTVAKEELLTLFQTQTPDGRIPHETVYEQNQNYSLSRKIQLWFLKRTFEPDGRSLFIDPPVYLWAAADLLHSNSSLSKEEKETIQNAIDKKLFWIQKNRTIASLPEPFCDLPILLHPLESGTDFSPAFDSIYGGLSSLFFNMIAIPLRMKPKDWNLNGKIPANPRILLFDLTYISFYLLALEKNGKHSEALATEFLRSFFNPEQMAFDSFYLNSGKIRRVHNPTFSALLPFLLNSSDDETAKKAIKRHCLPGGTFYKGKIPHYNAVTQSTKSKHLWRGSCSWMNMNFCHWLLLKKYCFYEEAEMLAQNIKEYQKKGHLPEFFDAFTGHPRGNPMFSWNGLIDAMES